MTGELEHLQTPRERRQYAFGCVRAILLTPPGPGEPGRVLVGVVAAEALACLAAVAAGLVLYPGLRTGIEVWFALIAFLGTLGVYLLLSMVVVAQLAKARTGLGLGLLGGAAITALWLLVGVAASFAPAAGLLAVVLLPLASLAVGAAGAWQSRRATSGGQVALLAAVIGGLLLFFAWVAMAVVTGGRPYDPGLLRDFRSSGAPDLATYAVNDNLGAGMILLLLVPSLTVSLGSVGAAIAARVRARKSGVGS